MSNLAKYVFPTVIDEAIIYPDSDGKPMSDNTKQYQYIILLQVNLDDMFAGNPDVFVAADLLWYPLKGRPSIRAAPDTMVILGRPKGHRGSYQQWKENDIAPQVVFEILSPGNTWQEMSEKRRFYERYGVQEYYEYDPDNGTLQVWMRDEEGLRPISFVGGWQSPLLEITMRLEPDGALSVFYPDGSPFLPPVESRRMAREAMTEAAQERERAEQAQEQAEQERERAEQAQEQADHERERAEQAYKRAEQAYEHLAKERQRAEQAEQDRTRLIAKLRELGIDPTTL